MKISVTVKARQKREKIKQAGKQEFILWVKAPAKEGKANRAVINILSSHFHVAKSRWRIIHGDKHKNGAPPRLKPGFPFRAESRPAFISGLKAGVLWRRDKIINVV